ncbi:pseudouridine synthase [Chitinophaga rhizosphaerae]|uniref:pseudouridine synthase n=1 Tax=Chitinophaga rhizosphaerae TaxID=1864947 RepID=UPI000F8043D7|nr:pseudouridine synthase [Chitinophaga rhizosphaerae]
MSLSYFAVYKPFQVLTRFGKEGDKAVLSDYFDVPKDVYPVGRLDYDSEGLLILTNDKSLNQRLLHPSQAHEREYWVQVDGAITPEAVRQLEAGVTITVDGKPFRTKPAKASLFTAPPEVPDRNPPIRFRQHIPAPWIRLVLSEGKNRQVRKMTAAVGFPTLRLIRYRIGRINVKNMQPGDMVMLGKKEIEAALFR